MKSFRSKFLIFIVLFVSACLAAIAVERYTYSFTREAVKAQHEYTSYREHDFVLVFIETNDDVSVVSVYSRSPISQRFTRHPQVQQICNDESLTIEKAVRGMARYVFVEINNGNIYIESDVDSHFRPPGQLVLPFGVAILMYYLFTFFTLHRDKLKTREYLPYTSMLVINLAFIAIAFIADTPADVYHGFITIITSRSILITDYVEIGGVGAAMLNVGIVGLWGTTMMLRLGVKPTGINIMGLWLSIGFAFFGKNVFNMIPLTVGVWMFSKYAKKPFSEYYLAALLVATLSPTISEIAFLGRFSPLAEIPVGILMGFVVGFIFPVISAESVKTHSGFNLYNMGFSGGLIATVLSTLFRNFGVEVVRPETGTAYGNDMFFAILLYSIALFTLLMGIVTELGKSDFANSVKKNFKGFIQTHGYSGKLTTDFYHLFGNSIYINMAVLFAFGTTVVLVMGGDLNGPNLAGIMTMAAFGSLGKHIKNVLPIMIGAVISSYANDWMTSGQVALQLSDPNTFLIMILFSSGLAPFAGQYGLWWGIAAGFLHVNIASYIGDLNMGLNLYNNGFAASFVIMFLLPITMLFRKETPMKR